MGLARAAGLPVVVVTDIDRGGSFAALYGTVALLEPADQALIAGFVINKFRGAREPARPRPGHDHRADRAAGAGRAAAGRPACGSTPRTRWPWTSRPARGGRPAAGAATCCGSAWSGCRGSATSPTSTRWPPSRACWSGWPASPAELADADLVVLPGSRATVADLAWLRDARASPRRSPSGPARACRCWASAAATRCWRREIDDEVESGAGRVAGLGLLPARVAFGADKTLGRPSGTAYGEPVRGYEIHHGVVTVTGPGRRAVPGRLPGRVGLGHELARHAGERRLPPGLPGRGGGAGRAGLPAGARTPASPGSGRSSWTCSATWSKSTWTPPRSPG